MALCGDRRCRGEGCSWSFVCRICHRTRTGLSSWTPGEWCRRIRTANFAGVWGRAAGERS